MNHSICVVQNVNSLVRKRDGRLEPYQEAKLESTLLKGFGSLASEEEQKNLAEDLARSLSFFLFRGREKQTPWRGRAGTIVTSEEVKLAVLRALRETGNQAAADRIEKRSAWRSDRRQKVVLPANDTLQVFNRGEESPWTKSRVLSKLIGIGLERELAEDIARHVEQRIFASGLQRISATLLQEMIDAELSQRGFSAQLGPRESLGWTSCAIASRLDAGEGQDPQAFAKSVAGHTLRQYALDQVFRGTVALAMEHGAIALLGAQGSLSILSIDLGKAASSSLLTLAKQSRSLSRYGLCYLNWSPTRELAAQKDLGDWVGALSSGRPQLVTRLSGSFALLGREQEWRTPLHIDLMPKSVTGTQALELLSFLKTLAIKTPVTVSLSHTGTPSYPWSNHGEQTAVTDLCFINLARVALRAGRGERSRFSNILEVAIKLGIEALCSKRNLLEGKVFRPDLPLWQPEKNTQSASLTELPTSAEFVHGLVPVGLTGAMSYLIGEPLGESARGERLAEDVFREFRKQARQEGKRQKLRVGIYESCGPDSDMISRSFSQADLMGFPEAGELQAGSQGYEVGIPKVDGSLRRKLTRALGLARSLDSTDLHGLTEDAWMRWLKAGACLTAEESAVT